MTTSPPYSLTRRLTGRVLALVALGWLAAAAGALWVLDHETAETLDDALAHEAQLLAAMADRGAALPSRAGDDRTVRIIGPTTRVPSAVTSDLVASGFRTMRFSGSSSSLVSAQLADYFRNSYTGTRVVLARTGGGRTSDPAIAAGQRAPVLVVTTSAPGSVTSLVQRSPHWPAVRALGSTTRVSSASLTKVRRA